MSRSIVITSGKGGVGKTTLTAGLGKKLAQLGARVVLVDTDFGLNNLDVLMNIENKVSYDLVDVAYNRCRIKQALIEDMNQKGLYILPSNHSYETANLDGQSIRAVIKNLKLYFDYIIVDCPAGIELGFHRSVVSCDEAIVISTPHISSIRDADKVIKLLKSYQIPTNVVINRVRGDLVLNSEMLSFEDISGLLSFPPIGMIPEDDFVNQQSNYRVVSEKTDGVKAINMLAESIHLGTNEVYDVTKKYRGFLGSIKRNIKKHI